MNINDEYKTKIYNLVMMEAELKQSWSVRSILLPLTSHHSPLNTRLKKIKLIIYETK